MFLDSIKKRSEFLNVKYKGNTFRGRNLLLQGLKNNLEKGQVGFIVTKKIGTAVIRNRIKRRLRAVLFDIKDKVCFAGLNIVLIPRSNVASMDYNELMQEVLKGMNYLNGVFIAGNSDVETDK